MSVDHGFVVGWTGAVRGREADAAEVFQTFVAYFAPKIVMGQIASFEPVLLSPHGGDMNGFMLVRGERAKLDTIKSSDDFHDLVARALHCVEGFGIIDAYIGAQVQKQMGLWTKHIKK